jgi:hypothetical protein
MTILNLQLFTLVLKQIDCRKSNFFCFLLILNNINKLTLIILSLETLLINLIDLSSNNKKTEDDADCMQNPAMNQFIQLVNNEFHVN